MVVGRIKHLGNKLGFVFALHRFFVIALRERTHIELCGRSRRPQPQYAHARVVAVTGNHNVVGKRVHARAVHIPNAHFAVLHILLNSAAEIDGEPFIRTRHHPNFAARQPHIGQFDLLIVHYALTEQTVLIADSKAHCGIVERRKTVHKTGSEPTQTAVTQARVRFALENIVERKIHFFQAFVKLIGKTEVEQIVFERASDKELHT